jgi:spore coat protein CotH
VILFRWMRGLTLATIAWLLAAGLAGAQTSADLFDPDTLQEVRLFINSRDLLQLRERFTEDRYFAADLEWRSIRVRNAAVRNKGLATRNPTKLGLRIEFDHYTTGQRFLGMRSLLLDNLWTDPSMVRERVSMAFFTRLGQAAPRESFCRLFINNVLQGVYALVEDVDSTFVSRTIDDGFGYLHEYRFVTPYFGEFLGEDLEAYKSRFAPRSHDGESDSAQYGPIRDMFRAINQADAATWESAVDPLLDLSQFVTHVAIETFLAENDGILGAAGMANFYLYRPSNSFRHRLIVVDKDTTFFDVRFSVLTRTDENAIFRQAFAVPRLRTLYLQVLEDCARAAAVDGWLEAEIARALAPIEAAVREDPRKQFSNDDFDQTTASMREFARARSGIVLSEVARLRAGLP